MPKYNCESGQAIPAGNLRVMNFSNEGQDHFKFCVQNVWAKQHLCLPHCINVTNISTFACQCQYMARWESTPFLSFGGSSSSGLCCRLHVCSDSSPTHKRLLCDRKLTNSANLIGPPAWRQRPIQNEHWAAGRDAGRGQGWTCSTLCM